MKRCLSERALLRVHTHDGTVVEREHLQGCADCAQRYDALAEDLTALQRILEEPAPAAVAQGVSPLRLGWIPMAAAAAALIALLVSGPWLRQPTPVPLQVALRRSNVSAFAADVSAALFANDDPSTMVALAPSDAPYLQAALDAGSPCTRDRYFNGECDDQLSALILESD